MHQKKHKPEEIVAKPRQVGIHFWTVTEGDMTDARPARKDFMRLHDRIAAADRRTRSQRPQQHD